jgi:hypothetical protein
MRHDGTGTFRTVSQKCQSRLDAQIATDGNCEAWTTAVRNTIDSLQGGHRSPTVIVGYSL